MKTIDYILKTALVYLSPSYARGVAEKYWILHDEKYRELRAKQFEDGTIYDIYRKILKIMNPKKDVSILDAGCGSGELVYYFYNDGYNIRGFDVSPKAVKMANKLIGKELCYVDDFLSLKDRTKSYDIVYIYNSLFYIHPKHLKIVFKNFYDILNDGGKLYIFDVPDFRKRRKWYGTHKWYKRLVLNSVTTLFPVYHPYSAAFWIKDNHIIKNAYECGFRDIIKFDSWSYYRSHYVLHK